MKMLNLTALLAIFVFTSCCTSNKTTANTTINDGMETKEMVEAGFIMGTIVASTAENDCPYVISSEVDGTAVMYDPTNLKQEFMKDGMKIWYKFSAMRMMNRCQKANPVNIIEIKKI